MLKLKLQYFGHLMQRVDSFAKSLMLGKIEGRRIRGHQRIKCPTFFQDEINSSLNEFKELLPLNCGVGEDSSESLGLQGDPTSPS